MTEIYVAIGRDAQGRWMEERFELGNCSAAIWSRYLTPVEVTVYEDLKRQRMVGMEFIEPPLWSW